MLKDACHQPEIGKFSFIESLSPPRSTGQQTPSSLDQFDHQQTVTFNQPKTLNKASVKRKNQASAMVATSNKSSAISDNWYQADSEAPSLSLSQTINSASENYVNHQYHNVAKSSYVGKMLLAIASSYCLFILWWLFGHQGNRILTILTGGKQVVLSQSDVEFIDYLERSLDKIDQQLEAKRESEQNDVVYVPVYTPAPAIPQASSTASANLPSNSLPSNSLPTSEPKPALPTLKIPAPPPLPAATPINGSAEQITKISSQKPKVKHTLIGILELGIDNSAALVKIKGKTRRIWLGEEINSDGWILESVGNQRAKISYQGQVRSIAVGETF